MQAISGGHIECALAIIQLKGDLEAVDYVNYVILLHRIVLNEIMCICSSAGRLYLLHRRKVIPYVQICC